MVTDPKIQGASMSVLQNCILSTSPRRLMVNLSIVLAASEIFWCLVQDILTDASLGTTMSKDRHRRYRIVRIFKSTT